MTKQELLDLIEDTFSFSFFEITDLVFSQEAFRRFRETIDKEREQLGFTISENELLLIRGARVWVCNQMCEDLVGLSPTSGHDKIEGPVKELLEEAWKGNPRYQVVPAIEKNPNI